jgi:hypothetical protein
MPRRHFLLMSNREASPLKLFVREFSHNANRATSCKYAWLYFEAGRHDSARTDHASSPDLSPIENRATMTHEHPFGNFATLDDAAVANARPLFDEKSFFSGSGA